MNYLIFYFITVNLVGAGAVLRDKIAARRHQWRTREATFFLLALAGGSPGVYIAMRVWRHKTLHKRFMWGIPAIFILQAAACVLYFLIARGSFLD